MVAGSWLNTDKLYLEFGTQKAVNDPSGMYPGRGARREIELTVDLANITSSTAGTPNILSNSLFLPANMIPEEIQIISTSAAASVNATLNIGLINASDRSTVVTSQGLVNAITHSNFCGQGTQTVLKVGTGSVGSLVGTNAATVPTNLTAYWGTGSMAGTIRIRLFYIATTVISS